MQEENMKMKLQHAKARREEFKQKLDISCNDRKAAKERGDEKTIMRERIRAAYLTTFITRMNDEIYEMEKAFGKDRHSMAHWPSGRRQRFAKP